MDKKVFVKVSEKLYKDLMKNPNWKAYEIGLNDGRKEGRVEGAKIESALIFKEIFEGLDDLEFINRDDEEFPHFSKEKQNEMKIENKYVKKVIRKVLLDIKKDFEKRLIELQKEVKGVN